MKCSILAGLSGLVLSVAIAPATLAEVTAYNPNVAQATTAQTNAFELVSLANQGYLKAEGIASQNTLVTDYRNGHIDANTLVQAAVRANRISADTANDRSFVTAVDAALQTVSHTY